MKVLVCALVSCLLLIIKSNSLVSGNNNVCPTFDDYYTIKNNSKCWYDFAAELNLTETIKQYGYAVETYKATTSDGYILSLFRIPNNNLQDNARKGPIFLQHGLFGTAACFVGLGRNSLALLLSDAGYDVWLGNFRGTQYAEEHVNLTVFDKKYWEHSMDELGLYDIRAQIQLVAEKTGQKRNIIYIGHSLGTTAAMIYSTIYPDEAKNYIKLFVFIAPVAQLPNIVSPYKFLVPFADHLLNLADQNDLIRILSHSAPQKTLYRLICLESPVLMQNCRNLLNIFYGLQNQQAPENIPVFFNQIPGGSSVRVLRHSSDLVLNQFARYNYGPAENLKRYGNAIPPAYDVTKIPIPVYMMYAVSDWVCTRENSLNFYEKVPSHLKAGVYEVNVRNFNHNDFLYGKNAKSLVYDKLLRVLDKFDRLRA